MVASVALLALTAAIVVQDGTALRAAAHDQAPRQAQLARGDWLEVRGEAAGFLKVYDHRHERPGYVRLAAVRSYPVLPESGPALRALYGFFKDAPGQESLGVGLVALYLKAADSTEVGAETFEALGTMADRLARAASQAREDAAGAQVAAHLEVAESYGLKFFRFERDGRMVTCYDGEAFRRALALGGAPRAEAQAALQLTRPGCVDPGLPEVERRQLAAWRIDVVRRIDPVPLPPFLGNRVRLRLATLEAERVHERMRAGDAEGARAAGEAAVAALARVDRAQLADEDALWYEEVAVRVGATRWATEIAGVAHGPRVALEQGRPGETCVRLVPAGADAGARGEGARQGVLAERCTYGIVWAASARGAPRGHTVAVTVQPLPGWTELWLFRRNEAGWVVDVLPPAASDPDLGYVELAGFSPDGARALLVREARVSAPGTPARIEREFQVVRLDTLAVERRARNPQVLAAFKSWASADWKGRTLALR